MSTPARTVESCRQEMREQAHQRYVDAVTRAWEEYRRYLAFANTATIYPENWAPGATGITAAGAM